MGSLWKNKIETHNPKSAKSLRRLLWWHFFAWLFCIAVFASLILHIRNYSIEDEPYYQLLLMAIITSEVFIFQLLFRWAYLKKIITAVTCKKCKNVFGWVVISREKTHVKQTVETKRGYENEEWFWKVKTTTVKTTPVRCRCAFCGNETTFYESLADVSRYDHHDDSSITSTEEWDE